jgi:hypothetical protein
MAQYRAGMAVIGRGDFGKGQPVMNVANLVLHWVRKLRQPIWVGKINLIGQIIISHGWSPQIKQP